MIGASMARTTVTQALDRFRAKQDKQASLESQKLERFYTAGSTLKHELTRHPGETDAEGALKYARRVARAAAPSIVARITDTIADWTYGGEVERKCGGSDEQEILFAEMIQRAGIVRAQGEWGLSYALHSDAWIHVCGRGPKDTASKKGEVQISAPAKSAMQYQTDPNNPGRLIAVMERRLRDDALVDDGFFLGDEKWVDWVWTEDAYAGVTDQNRTIETGPNPYQRQIPYVRLMGKRLPGEREPVSICRDAWRIQNLILQHVSHLDRLVQIQTGGVPWVKGLSTDNVKVGTDLAVNLGANGEMGFAVPGADIEGVIRTIEWELATAFETAGIPISVVRGEAAESGYKLKLKVQSGLRIAETLRALAVEPEYKLIRLLCAVGRHFQIALPIDPSPSVDFKTPMLPVDEATEREADMQEVERGFRTLEDFLKRWRPDLDDAKRAAYVAQLEAKKQSDRAQETAGLFGGGGFDANALGGAA